MRTLLAPRAARAGTVSGIAMVVLASVLFAVNGTVSKLILQAGVNAAQLATLRATGAAIGLLALCAASQPGLRRLAARRQELPLLACYGLIGFLFVPLLYFIAIRRLPVGVALLFEYTSPLLVALWARFGQRKPVKARLWIGLAISLAGLAAVAEVWRSLAGQGHGGLNPIGVLAGLVAAVLLAVYYLAGAQGVAHRDPLSLTCWAFSFAALGAMVISPWWTFPRHVLGRSSGHIPVWLLALYLVCFGSIISYTLIGAGLRRLPPTSVGIIGMTEPVIASAVAWLALGERLSPVQLAGGVLILCGVTLAETARTSGSGSPIGPSPT